MPLLKHRIARQDVTPIQHFERMVHMGLINRKGQLTKRYGGEGEVEPDARPATAMSPRNGNGDH